MTKLDPKIEPLLWLQKAGFAAYLVGNAVRDRLLDNSEDNTDIDIATNARPDQVADILNAHRVLPGLVDEKFGVTSVRKDGIQFEITTFRSDIYDKKFADIRRYPDKIEFIKSARADAARRDLTINAIYYNPTANRFLDYVGGLSDMKAGIIRVIGNPRLRFKEDPIRILRAIRFRHQLGFKYHLTTEKALAASADLLAKVSPNVIKKEMQKLQALENYPEARQDLIRFGLIKSV